MDKAILYIHGKGGNPKEAEYYKALLTIPHSYLGKRKKSSPDCLITYAEHMKQ